MPVLDIFTAGPLWAMAIWGIFTMPPKPIASNAMARNLLFTELPLVFGLDINRRSKVNKLGYNWACHGNAWRNAELRPLAWGDILDSL